MRVLVALENRFLKTRNGNIYSTTVCDYSFWQRYLEVFDEVVIFARVKRVQESAIDRPCSNGPNVRFVSLPYFVGPWQYLRKYTQLKRIAKQAVHEADAFILRVPGVAASLIWQQLRRNNIPYAIEAVGDPWDVFGPDGVKSIFRPLFREITKRDMIQQCKNAIAASYQTEFVLQNRYPSEGWTTVYSDVCLVDEVFVDNQAIDTKIERIRKKVKTNGHWRLCHVGTMSALYKAQDVLIEAVTLCRERGFNVELTLLGNGKYRNVFMNKAKKLGLSEFIDFVGRVPPGKPVREHLDRADLFVLPSLTEGLPRALIEAMARALPCIGSNVGGIPELLDAEHLVRPGDAKELAEKIMMFISDSEKLSQMSKRNLEKAKEYGATKLNKRRVQFYKKVIESTKKIGLHE